MSAYQFSPSHKTNSLIVYPANSAIPVNGKLLETISRILTEDNAIQALLKADIKAYGRVPDCPLCGESMKAGVTHGKGVCT